MGVNSGTNRSRGGLQVNDNNGGSTVWAYGVNEIVVTAGTLVNNGQGKVTITTGGGGGGGSGTVNAGTQYEVAYYAATGTAVSGNAKMTFNDATEVFQVNGATAKIQSRDTTNNYAVTLLGGGGPKVQWGDTDSADDSFMVMGAYGGWNNIDNQGRDLRIFGNTGTMAWFDESASSVGIGNIYSNTVLPSTSLSAGATDAADDTVLRPFTVERITSGTPTAGIGVGMQFITETTAGNEIGSAIESVATDVGAGAEDFDLVFRNMEGGAAAAEVMRLTSGGDLHQIDDGSDLAVTLAGSNIGFGKPSTSEWSKYVYTAVATGAGVWLFRNQSLQVLRIDGPNGTAMEITEVSGNVEINRGDLTVTAGSVTAGDIVTATTGLTTGPTATFTYGGIQAGSVSIDGALGSHFICSGGSTPQLQVSPGAGSQIVIFREVAPGGDVVIDCTLAPVSGIFNQITLRDNTPSSVTLYDAGAGWVVVADSSDGVVYTP